MNSIITPRLVGFLALALVIAGNATGNILLKIGATVPQKNTLFGLLSWQTIAGIACFAFGILSYAWALKSIELHVAQIILSMQYVVVIGLAVVLLDEHVTPAQWVGIGFIALGLFICAR